MVRTISKSKLKANMLKLFRELEANGGELIVTDHNKPVLKITPVDERVGVKEAFVGWNAVFHEDPDTPTIDEWGEL